MVPISEEAEKKTRLLEEENLKLTKELHNVQIELVQQVAVESKASTVSREQNAAVVRELDTERTQSLQLQSRFEQLKRQQEKSEADVTQLRFEKLELELQNDFLIQQKCQLESQLNSVDLEKKTLLTTRGELASQYQSMTEQLNMASEELKKERMVFESAEVSGLSLASDLENLRSRHEKLEFLLDHLKRERMRSDLHVERLRILYNSFPSTEILCEAIYKSLCYSVIYPKATKSGFLTKKARNSNNWKRRFSFSVTISSFIIGQRRLILGRYRAKN